MNIRTIKPVPKNPRPSGERKSCRRVAAYARVSTDSTEQETSLEAQKDFFETYIKAHENWAFAGIYYDSGISGLSRRNRDGFNRMIEDALAGKVDLIITKSLSRFARNTVDTLTVIRKLKAAGVEVFFQKENIYTMDSKGEFLLTLMSSIAQEESRSISENVTWGQRKRFSDGRYSVPYKRFMGYDQGGTNQLVVNEEQAKVVRLIYRLYLGGLTEQKICKFLESQGIPSPSEGINWHKNVICSILKNEKYKGDALLQKCYTADFLSKAIRKNQGELPQYYVEKGHSPIVRINQGEVPQYYVENSHPAIVPPEEWEMVQLEISRRKALGKTYSGKSVFSAKLVCEDCGAFYGSKVWHSTDRYRKQLWQCNRKFSNEKRCQTPVLDSETIRRMFRTAYNQLMGNRAELIEDCQQMRKKLVDFAALDAEIAKQQEETQLIAKLVQEVVKENASAARSQEAYRQKYETLTERYESAAAELERLQNLRARRSQQDKAMSLFIRTLKKQPDILEEWDDTIWTMMVEKAIVHRDSSITFVFYNGSEISVGA